MDLPPLGPDDVRDIGFAAERDGYDKEIVDSLLDDIANVVHEGALPADLIPDDPAAQIPTRRRGYQRDEVDAVFARLRGMTDRDVATASGRTTSTLLSNLRLTVRAPAILGPDGSRLGKLEMYLSPFDAWLLTDAGGQTLLRVKARTMSWRVLDAEGEPIGRIKQWCGVLHGRPGRTKLYSNEGLIGRCRVELGSFTAWLRHTWGRPKVRRYVVTDQAKNVIARIEADSSKGRKTTLEVLQPLTEPLRSLVLCTAMFPAYPRAYESSPQVTP